MEKLLSIMVIPRHQSHVVSSSNKNSFICQLDSCFNTQRSPIFPFYSVSYLFIRFPMTLTFLFLLVLNSFCFFSLTTSMELKHSLWYLNKHKILSAITCEIKSTICSQGKNPNSLLP